MKAADVRKASPEDRLRKLAELRIELLKLRLQAGVGTLKDTARIRSVKRDIARLQTVIRESSREA
ncbi:MAG: 50S ribosomal protein L29 [Desulfurococcaceae archaeon]|nr:50S ribosomal protein L29 [Sulfolobales archaeon]MDW8170500.1 50S ribosomal protein L29 [Desulfurococcaceae archaeon]